MNKKSIVLASKSPRRRDILGNAGYKFIVMEADTDETPPKDMSHSDAVTEIALRKALYVKENLNAENNIIIAADTMVCKDNSLLGKPRDEENAFFILKSLSGAWHTVLTGYSVLSGDKIMASCEETAVKFRCLSDREIKEYIKSGEPFDKAGAYGVQGRASAFVERIEGDFFNVMGLPVCKISVLLDSEIYT
jgi:septum formation protein